MKERLFNLFPLLIVIAVAIYSVFPSIIDFTDSLIYLGDDILITWVLNQNIQKIPHDLGNVFQGNIFYPFKNTMLYSHMLIPSSIIGYLPVKLTGSFASAFNSAHIFGQLSLMVILYFWFKEMFKDKWAAAVGSVVLGLSQIHFHYIAHLHVWNMQWWLTALWMLWRFRKNGKVWQLYLAGLMFSIQIWENPLEFYRALVPAVIILLPKWRELIKNFRHLAAIILIVLIIVSPYLAAYIGFIREFSYVRPIREVAHFSMSLNFLWEHFFSPSLFGLFILSFVLVGYKKLKSDRNFNWMILTTITSFILSFGPVFKWKEKTFKFFGKIFIPLPYVLLYYTIPGFQAMRTPSRWMVMMAFGMAGIITLALSKYKGRYKNVVIFSALVIAIVGGIKVNFVPPIAPRPGDFPKVYDWLMETDGDAILEYPMYTWASPNNGLQKEFFRMMYSLKHKKNLVNGGSGYMPPSRQKLLGRINSKFPEKEIVDTLTNFGIDYVVVHKDEIDNVTFRKIDKWGRELLVWNDLDDYVYKLP